MSSHYPDGLTPDLIHALTTELTDTPQPTRALLDGTARERRERREARRALAAVLRSLPMTVCFAISDDQATGVILGTGAYGRATTAVDQVGDDIGTAPEGEAA